MKWGTIGISSIPTTRKNELKNYSGATYFPTKTKIKSSEWNFMINEILPVIDFYKDFWTKERERNSNFFINFPSLTKGYKGSRELGLNTSLYNGISNSVVQSLRMTRINLSSVKHRDFLDSTNTVDSNNSYREYSTIMSSYVVKVLPIESILTFLPTLNPSDQPGTFDHGDLDVSLVTENRRSELHNRGFIPNELIRARELNYAYNYMSQTLNDSNLLDRGALGQIQTKWQLFEKYAYEMRGVGSIKELSWNPTNPPTIQFIPSSTTFLKITYSNDTIQYRSLGSNSYSNMDIQRINSNTIKWNSNTNIRKVEAI